MSSDILGQIRFISFCYICSTKRGGSIKCMFSEHGEGNYAKHPDLKEVPVGMNQPFLKESLQV